MGAAAPFRNGLNIHLQTSHIKSQSLQRFNEFNSDYNFALCKQFAVTWLKCSTNSFSLAVWIIKCKIAFPWNCQIGWYRIERTLNAFSWISTIRIPLTAKIHLKYKIHSMYNIHGMCSFIA